MNKIQQRRCFTIIIMSILVTIAITFILFALKQNINVFFTPNQLPQEVRQSLTKQIRLGGLVKEKSVVREKEGLGVHFIVTDLKKEIQIYYNGILPDLFHENKGIIVQGKFNESGILIANQVLAKHDENYMPKNVYEALRKNTA